MSRQNELPSSAGRSGGRCSSSLAGGGTGRVGAGLAICGILVVCGGLACALFVLMPQLDLAVAGLFYDGAHFVGDSHIGRLARGVARAAPFLLLIAMLLAWLAGRMGITAGRHVPRGSSIAWLTLSFLLGPGLVVDGLKDISHRPRPVQVTDFGGTRDFRPFYRFDGACPRNCSFPSGETAAAFWTLAPATLAPPPMRGAAIGAALIFAAGTAALRLAFGGHFLSDVVFAALLTLGVAAGLRRLLPRGVPK